MNLNTENSRYIAITEELIDKNTDIDTIKDIASQGELALIPIHQLYACQSREMSGIYTMGIKPPIKKKNRVAGEIKLVSREPDDQRIANLMMKQADDRSLIVLDPNKKPILVFKNFKMIQCSAVHIEPFYQMSFCFISNELLIP